MQAVLASAGLLDVAPDICRAWAGRYLRPLFALSLFVAALRPLHARAQQPSTVETEALEFGARAEVRAPLPATNVEDATAAGTRIDVRERSGALEGVHEVLAQVPGAHVQSTGGLGAFSGVALRGAELGHTTVLFGDLPLNTPDMGAFDLSLVPLPVLDSIEIYRGGAPAWWSDGSIGGVVRLVPRTAEQSYLRLQSGFGSFGRFELGATSSVVSSRGLRPTLFTHVDVARADNDYAYVDDGQTRFDTAQGKANADDVTLHQRNAGIALGNGLAHAGMELLGGRLDLVLLGHARTEGIPGPLAAPTLQVHRRLVRALGAVSYTKESLDAEGERRYRVQLLASGNLQNNQLTDLIGELGVARDTASNDNWSRAYARTAASVALLPYVEPTLIASVAHDAYRPEDRVAFSNPSRPSGRSSEGLAFELRLHGQLGKTRFELRSSARAQWSQTSIWTSASTPASGTRERRADLVSTYRVAGVVAPWSMLAFSASAASGARVPSILELFGDRVFQQANPSLRPERSRTADVSAVLSGHAGELRGNAELRGFVLSIEDLIAYRRTSQYTVKPENIDSASILGVELGTQGSYGRHLSLAGSLTAMQTRNQFDRSLPLRPPLQFSVRPEVVFYPPFAERVALFVEAEHVSFVYLDPANQTFLDGRTILSAGGSLRILHSHVTLAARAQNLFNVLATDVLSRPLPGFNVLVSIAVEEGLD